MSPPGTYFVNTVTYQRRNLFISEPMARLFLKTLYSYRRQLKFLLHAFVVMPEHVHLLLTPMEIPIERAMQFVKGGFSHAVKEQLGSNLEIWERGFTDHRVRDIADFHHHRVYIHDNPVRRGLVDDPSEYRFSSAFPGFKLDLFPPAVDGCPKPTSGAKALTSNSL